MTGALLRPGVGMPAIIDHVVEEPPLAGATCDRPDRETFIAACKRASGLGPGAGISEEGMAKCGKPAVVSVTTYFTNCPTKHDICCEDCRPRRLP